MPWIVLAAVVAVGVTSQAAHVWLVLLYDGVLAAGVIAAAAGWGAWPTVWLGGQRRPRGQRFCTSIALGLGVIATLTLVAGVGGLLTRYSAWGLVVVGWLLGIARLYVEQGRGAKVAGETPSMVGPGRGDLVLKTLVLLTLVAPLVTLLFGATLPPGVLWSGENFAYDVREYHLQVPREYFDAGRIEFLPHNVYASFPQQTEILYLLLMHMAGGPYEGALAAQLLHGMFAMLAVVALVSWTKSEWGRWVVIAAAGSLPWLGYLGCLAYVECATLFFAAVAGGLVLEQINAHPSDTAEKAGRVAMMAGLIAGLAGACKYTSLALVAAPLALVLLLISRGKITTRVRLFALFILGSAIALSPWLIRNAAFTGNPVYPFGYSLFGGKAWSAQQDEQWAAGHQVTPERASPAGRARTTWEEMFASRMFGPSLFVLAIGGALLARSRAALALLLWLVVGVVAWTTLTHMPGRFLVPLIAPLALLAGRCGSRAPRWAYAGVAIAIAGGVWNSVHLLQLAARDAAFWHNSGVELSQLCGATHIFIEVDPIRETTPPDASVWLVGDAAPFYTDRRVHYTVVFSRDPWLAYASDATPEQAVDWLRTQNVTHVVFSWDEIERLGRTYGFPEWVTPAWVARLADAGLVRIAPPDGQPGRYEIYEVFPK